MSPASKKSLLALLSSKALVIAEFLNSRVGGEGKSISLAFAQQTVIFLFSLTLFIQNVKNLFVGVS